ncbi:mitochondrial carrier family [Micromonas pusilla CCMP1545]|jgi:solute carrier family 25 S-adenosylmethionine transporter 26|uniref:Mitochondrial carrier family n=1 Tax=Micromonas pusilla (strain CCMP1545) TaxID=564608 RepID=C1MT43_MICPC|nr:mitochondrial carrier family [Micromonas pusilla CCMP1545]EEH57251.1 mitochondrial carrier family [Micromonas pusilla CCMP1545]|eukprot:XP_003058796.1 mitochondrial carrier family [Micromonas pusilla CCMP1545]
MGRHHDSKVESRAPEGQMHPFCVGLLGGAAAGLTVNSCLFPLNTIKTRLQARVVGTPIRETLFKNLYRGFIIDTAGSIPGTGLFMASYEVIKATGRVPALVGAASAAGVASLITAPCDAIKQRLQVNASATLANELKAVATSRNPLKTMFVGYPQFLLRDLPFDAIQMTSFEVLKRWHCDAFDPGRPRTAKELALLGGAAGAFTGFVTTPLDVARTAEVCAGLNGVKCTGVMCLVELVRQGGPGVLVRGSLPRMLEISLGGTLYFSALEATKKALGWVDPCVVKVGEGAKKGGGGKRETKTPGAGKKGKDAIRSSSTTVKEKRGLIRA